jgi:hypothetical protein
VILSNSQKLPHSLMRLLPKPQVGEGGVWQPSSRLQVARRGVEDLKKEEDFENLSF